MGGPRRSWFLAPWAPNFDCSPGGYLGLGSIIKDPLRPDEPITRKIPSSLPNNVPVQVSNKTNWREQIERASKGQLGVWAQFLQFIGIEDASVNWMRSNGSAYKFREMDIQWMLPPVDFVQSQMRLPEVEQYVNSGTTRPGVYMIIAIMIVRDASVKQTQASGGGFHFKLGADLAAAGAPGWKVGPDVGLSTNNMHEISIGESSDFVFAYRLRKIQYKRKSWFSSERETTATDTPYEPQKGTAFDNEADQFEQPKQVIDFDSVGIADGNVTSQDLSLDGSLEAFDEFEEEDCECILPG